MMQIICFLAASALVWATPILTTTGKYPIKKSLKMEAGAVKPLSSAFSETEIKFDSFDPADKTGRPLVSNHSFQIARLKKLAAPVDPQAPEKDGSDERMEITISKFSSLNKVNVPGVPKPFETKIDLSSFLLSKPLVFASDGKGTRRVEGLDDLKLKATQELLDPVARSTAMQFFSEVNLVKMEKWLSRKASCMEDLEGKKPGEQWKYITDEQGMKFEYDCRFEGWAEVKKKKVAVIRFTSPKQSQIRPQPNGVPALTQTEISGTFFFEPESQENLLRVESKISVEPTESAASKESASGSRNRSTVISWEHLYPI